MCFGPRVYHFGMSRIHLTIIADPMVTADPLLRGVPEDEDDEEEDKKQEDDEEEGEANHHEDEGYSE